MYEQCPKKKKKKRKPRIKEKERTVRCSQHRHTHRDYTRRETTRDAGTETHMRARERRRRRKGSFKNESKKSGFLWLKPHWTDFESVFVLWLFTWRVLVLWPFISGVPSLGPHQHKYLFVWKLDFFVIVTNSVPPKIWKIIKKIKKKSLKNRQIFSIHD